MRVLFDVLIQPFGVFEHRRSEASWFKAFFWWGLVGFFLGALVGFLVWVAGWLSLGGKTFGPTVVDLFVYFYKTFGVWLLVVSALFFFVLFCLFGLLLSGLLFLSARLLGGKGRFVEQFFLSSLLVVPFSVLFFAAGFFGWAQHLGLWLYLLVAAYWLVLSVIVVRIAHGLSWLRSAACVVLFVVVVSALGYVVWLAYFLKALALPFVLLVVEFLVAWAYKI